MPPGKAAKTGSPARSGGPALRLRRVLSCLRLPRHRRSGGWRGLRKWRLRAKDLYECLIGALLVGISAANSNRANQLIVHNDRETARNKVVAQAFRLAEVQPNHPAIDGVEPLRDRGRRGSGVQRGLGF